MTDRPGIDTVYQENRVLEQEIKRLRDELADALKNESHYAKEIIKKDKRIEELMKIVMEVSTKYPGETRAETAQRYVRERENRPMECAGRAIDGEEVSDE